MKNVTRHKVSPVALLVLLGLLLFIVVGYRFLTAKEAERTAVQVQDNVVRARPPTIAVVAMVALLVYVLWTVLRANQREAKAIPPAKESSASDETVPR
jgi:hypothetical protein